MEAGLGQRTGGPPSPDGANRICKSNRSWTCAQPVVDVHRGLLKSARSKLLRNSAATTTPLAPNGVRPAADDAAVVAVQHRLSRIIWCAVSARRYAFRVIKNSSGRAVARRRRSREWRAYCADRNPSGAAEIRDQIACVNRSPATQGGTTIYQQSMPMLPSPNPPRTATTARSIPNVQPLTTTGQAEVGRPNQASERH
jgi:hypothetical protein